MAGVAGGALLDRHHRGRQRGFLPAQLIRGQASDLWLAGLRRRRVTIDHTDPHPGPGAATTAAGALVSAARARRLACDATVARTVLGPDSAPIDLGRIERRPDGRWRTRRSDGTQSGIAATVMAHDVGGPETRLPTPEAVGTLPLMARTRMHADEVLTDEALVRRLLLEQFPGWARLPVRYVRSSGTDNDVYRLGEDLVARLPRIGRATAQVSAEAHWLPRLAPHLPLAVPAPVAVGRPGSGYPYAWAVNEWLPGTDAHGGVGDLDRAASDLAEFVRALRAVDPHDGPDPAASGRGGPLAERDEDVRRSIALLGDRIDGDAALRSWTESLEAPVWEGAGVWVHGDLLPGNLLVRAGRLAAVIDFGGLAVGDPACDLQPAWNVFHGRSRRIFLDELGTDASSRLRGRGWVLSQAVIALPYYWDTNPGIVRQALHAVGEVLVQQRPG